jgi:hypothetical protein
MTRDLARATEPREQDRARHLEHRHCFVAEPIPIGAGGGRDARTAGQTTTVAVGRSWVDT